MKNKYNDNKLAEEFDLIVLVNDMLAKNGLPKGSLGTLTYSYTGASRPLYAEFSCADGSKREEALALDSFRVLNMRSDSDVTLVQRFLEGGRRKKA